MSRPYTNARTARPVSCAENECGVQIETALRIRPLLKKERDDPILLEEQRNSESGGDQVVILNPPQPCRPDRTDPTEYHFNHILPESTSQDKIYYTLGLPIVAVTIGRPSV